MIAVKELRGAVRLSLLAHNNLLLSVGQVAPLGDFKKNWEALGPEQEVMEHFQLQVRGIEGEGGTLREKSGEGRAVSGHVGPICRLSVILMSDASGKFLPCPSSLVTSLALLSVQRAPRGHRGRD